MLEKMKKTFATDRMILRPWQEDDAKSLYEYAKDPEVGPSAGWPIHTSVENSREIIKEVLAVDGTYAVCLKESNKPIGSVGVMKIEGFQEDEVELGYWIGKPFWGKGYIPEVSNVLISYCFEEMGVTKILCNYYEGNLKSKRVQEKLGFHYVGSKEEFLTLVNKSVITHMQILTKEDWLKKNIG